jgi:hypothetical protein
MEIVHWSGPTNSDRVKERISEKTVDVNHVRDPPAMFRHQYPWAPILSGIFDEIGYPVIRRRDNIRPKVTLLREYRVLSVEQSEAIDVLPTYVEDRYARIGDQFVCSRRYNTRHQAETLIIPMRLTEEQKESIAAAAMHPSRLEKWLARGWEDEWDKYFSS